MRKKNNLNLSSENQKISTPLKQSDLNKLNNFSALHYPFPRASSTLKKVSQLYAKFNFQTDSKPLSRMTLTLNEANQLSNKFNFKTKIKLPPKRKNYHDQSKPDNQNPIKKNEPLIPLIPSQTQHLSNKQKRMIFEFIVTAPVVAVFLNPLVTANVLHQGGVILQNITLHDFIKRMLQTINKQIQASYAKNTQYHIKSHVEENFHPGATTLAMSFADASLSGFSTKAALRAYNKYHPQVNEGCILKTKRFFSATTAMWQNRFATANAAAAGYVLLKPRITHMLNSNENYPSPISIAVGAFLASLLTGLFSVPLDTSGKLALNHPNTVVVNGWHVKVEPWWRELKTLTLNAAHNAIHNKENIRPPKYNGHYASKVINWTAFLAINAEIKASGLKPLYRGYIGSALITGLAFLLVDAVKFSSKQLFPDKGVPRITLFSNNRDLLNAQEFNDDAINVSP